MEFLRTAGLFVTLALAGCGFRYLPEPEFQGPVLADQAIKNEQWRAFSPEAGYQLDLEFGYEDPSHVPARFVHWQVFSLYRLHPINDQPQGSVHRLSNYQRDTRFSLRGTWQMDAQGCQITLFKAGNEKLLTLVRQQHTEHRSGESTQGFFKVQQSSLAELEGLVFSVPEYSTICN